MFKLAALFLIAAVFAAAANGEAVSDDAMTEKQTAQLRGRGHYNWRGDSSDSTSALRREIDLIMRKLSRRNRQRGYGDHSSRSCPRRQTKPPCSKAETTTTSTTTLPPRTCSVAYSSTACSGCSDPSTIGLSDVITNTCQGQSTCGSCSGCGGPYNQCHIHCQCCCTLVAGQCQQCMCGSGGGCPAAPPALDPATQTGPMAARECRPLEMGESCYCAKNAIGQCEATCPNRLPKQTLCALPGAGNWCSCEASAAECTQNGGKATFDVYNCPSYCTADNRIACCTTADNCFCMDPRADSSICANRNFLHSTTDSCYYEMDTLYNQPPS